MKCCNIHKSGLLESEALVNLKLCKVLLTKQETYNHLQHTWKSNHMHTVQGYLEWYNNLNVLPFIETVKKMHNCYRGKRVNLFREAISVPGIARSLLFSPAWKEHPYLALCSSRNVDLYTNIKNNNISGNF